MKQKNKIISIFLVLGILLALVFNFLLYIYTEHKLLKETSSTLNEDAKTKSEEINSHLSRVKEDIEALQESEEVKKLLRDKLIFDENVIKANVDERARVISKEAENYLRARPGMTLKDLQEDKTFKDIVMQPVSRTFKDIVVQPVGKEGYSFAYDTDTLINYFHKEPRRIGYDYNDLKDTFPDLWRMIKATSKNDSVEGFYTRDEMGGSVSHKYGKFVRLSVLTADGIRLSVGATAYVEDYKIVESKSDYLNSIKENSDYYNIILISPDGYVNYMAEQKADYYGTNLEWEVNFEKGLTNQYLQTKNLEGTSFYGPFIETYGQIYPVFSVMVPVFDSEKLLGYLAIVDDMKEIFKVAEDTKDLGKTGEAYLIDGQELLISPLRNRRFDVMVQSVNSENAVDCFEDLKDYYNYEE